MRKKTGFVLMLCIAALLTACLSGCGLFDGPPKAAEDEIMLVIQLDLKEDIGLLILDNTLDGTETSGGISNADRSLLKHDELLYWTINKEVYEDPADTVDLSVRFRVITQYCDPNYENEYPEEATALLDAISFKAEFGKEYHITITGDKQSGYKAVLNEQ